MSENSVGGIRIPKETFDKIEKVKNDLNVKRVDVFRFFNGMLPAEILKEDTIRLPKSKEILKYIDVRYIFKLK